MLRPSFNRARPHLRGFVRIRILFDAFRPSVLTNTRIGSTESAEVWKRSRKWIKTNPYIFRGSVDGPIRTKMETMTSTVPRGRITGSRAKIKNQNGETKHDSIFLKSLVWSSISLFSIFHWSPIEGERFLCGI